MPFATRAMPSLMRATLKLISSPRRLSASRRYVNNCFLCTGAMASTDLISTITLSSTIRSARNPISIRALVDDGNHLLPERAETSSFQVKRQNHFIDRFQQTRPEAGMNAVGRVHDLRRQLVFRHIQLKTISLAKTPRSPRKHRCHRRRLGKLGLPHHRVNAYQTPARKSM